jgi:hypothetical protein
MKKIFLTFALIASFCAFSQNTKQPFIINHCVDKLTDKEYYFPDSTLICANPEKSKGFTISPNFRAKKESFVQSGFICENVNIGNCDENDSLIILFEDESKITLTSWNKFNCEGNVYFGLSNEEYNQLSTKKISIIRFSNGYTHDTFTYSLKESEKDFFIQAYTNYKVVEIDCSN